MSETGGLKNGYVKGTDNEKEIIRKPVCLEEFFRSL